MKGGTYGELRRGAAARSLGVAPSEITRARSQAPAAIAISPARGNRGGASSGGGFDPDQFLVAARALACNGDCGVQGVCIPFFLPVVVTTKEYAG
jgi:hypothetical protein